VGRAYSIQFRPAAHQAETGHRQLVSVYVVSDSHYVKLSVVNCLDVTACHSEERSDEESGVGPVHTS